MVNMDNISNKVSITDKEISRATHLSLVEILLGSVGHGLKIPFTGQFLSLYQLNVLANSLNKDSLPRSSTVEISGIVAVMKSLSPAGQKLGPMVSILSQGILFWSGTLMGGVNIFGQLLGATLLSLWSFIQPLITYGLVYGIDLFRMIEFYREKTAKEYPYAQKYLIGFVICLILLKIILAWAIIGLSFFKKDEWLLETKNLEKLIPKQKQADPSVWKKAFKDLLNPLFLFSFFLMVIFLWQIETNMSRVIWLSLRPLAIAYLIFYAIRSPIVHKFLSQWAEKSKAFKRFYDKAILILEKIEKSRNDNL